MSIHLHISSSFMSHTYESEAHSSLSTIDHILCSQHLLPQVSRARTLEEDVLNTSDHIPVMAELCFPSSPVHSTPTDTATNNSCTPRRNWDGITKANIKHLYTIPLQPQLKEIQQSSQTIIPTQIDQLLESLISVMLNTSTNIPPKLFCSFKTPGWSPTLKATCKDLKHCYRLWVTAGRPRNPTNPVFMIYKAAKKRFRQSLRQTRKNANETFFSSLDSETDPRRSFRAVRNRMSPLNLRPPTNYIIHEDTIYNDSSILEGWASYFESPKIFLITTTNREF